MSEATPSNTDDLYAALLYFSDGDWENCTEFAKRIRDSLRRTGAPPEGMLWRALASSSGSVVAAAFAAAIRMSERPSRAAARLVAWDTLDESMYDLVLRGVALWMSERALCGDACLEEFLLWVTTRSEWLRADNLSDLPLVQDLVDQASQGIHGESIRANLESTVRGLIDAYRPYRIFLYGDDDQSAVNEDHDDLGAIVSHTNDAVLGGLPVAHDRVDPPERLSVSAADGRVRPSAAQDDVGVSPPLLSLSASHLAALELPSGVRLRVRSAVSPTSNGAHAAGVDRSLDEIAMGIQHTQLEDYTDRLLPELKADVAVRMYKRDPAIILIEGDFEYRAYGEQALLAHEGPYREVAIDVRRREAVIRITAGPSDVVLVVTVGGGHVSAAFVDHP